MTALSKSQQIPKPQTPNSELNNLYLVRHHERSSIAAVGVAKQAVRLVVAYRAAGLGIDFE